MESSRWDSDSISIIKLQDSPVDSHMSNKPLGEADIFEVSML